MSRHNPRYVPSQKRMHVRPTKERQDQLARTVDYTYNGAT
jgi:hypothetical protein